jgi:hypothetical protein
MAENSSLSDYLYDLRRSAPPAGLRAAIGAGGALAVLGVVLGPRFAAMTGLGCAVAGVCTWAWANQAADATHVGFSAEASRGARWLRAAGIAALGVAGVGALLLFYSLAFHLVGAATGL